MGQAPRGEGGVAIILILGLVTLMSQFFRSSLGVIAPELRVELALDAQTLGFAVAAFFFALAAGQLPLGIAIDRFGSRVSMTVLTGVTVAGSALTAFAWDGPSLIAGRAITGIGCAGYFMGAAVIASAWFGQARYATVLSWITAMAGAGNLVATMPLAWVAEAHGWRTGFVGAAVIAVVLGAVFFVRVRDAPPGTPPPQAGDSWADVVDGLVQVVKTPGIFNIMALQGLAYASFFTVLGLWAGPYFNDIHGLDEVTRGWVLAAMATGQMLGLLLYGPLDRVFNSRRGVISTGAVGTIAILAALAVLEAPSLVVVVPLMVALCIVTSYNIVLFAHGRSLFPDRLAGRGMTTLNLGLVGGTAGMPALTGIIIESFPARADGAVEEVAYRAAFATMAGLLAVGLLIYRRLPDSKPLPVPKPLPDAGPPAVDQALP